MAKLEFQDWQIANDKKPNQSQPHSLLHTFLLLCWILAAIVMMGLGWTLIFNTNIRAEDLSLAIVASIIVIGIIYIFGIATHITKKRTKVLLLGCLFIVGGILTPLLVNFFNISFRLLTGIFGIVIAAFMFLDVYREVKDHAPYFSSLFWGLVYLAFGCCILFLPDGTRILAILTGIYLIFFSLNVALECLGAFFYRKPRFKKNFIVTLPIFISAFLPMALFREINEMVKEEPDEVLKLQEPSSGKEPPLIVYVHTRAGLIPGFGHCDLCYKGKVYSYGDYDEGTWKMGGFLADGVLAEVSPEKHIIMALKDDKKILMAYGIQLTKDLEDKIQEKLDNILSQTYQWKPQAQLAAEGKIKADPKSFKDVGSVMYLEEDAELFKFKTGPYKTYYGLGQNCSEVVNDVVGNTGIKLFKLNGIVTPGSYLEYLDELYETDNSIVTDRRLYMLDEDGKPVEYPLNPKEPIRIGDLSQ